MSSPEFLPTALLTTLQHRAGLLQTLRNFFTGHGYWEAETPILSRDCCIDLWLDPFRVTWGKAEQGYLQTSPEFALKRLICAGADRVFEVARVFRQDEIGVRHNPEFTMIEWYQRDCDHHAQMDFVEKLVCLLRDFAGEQRWVKDLPEIPARFHRLSYEEAFLRFTGVSPSASSLDELFTAASRLITSLPSGIESDRDGLLNLLLAEVIEPEFTKLQAVFLYDFPATQAALAKIRPGEPPAAERFELYLNGMEICNGYHELTDADELRKRMLGQNKLRQQLGKAPLPEESRLLQAMEHGMPECSGVALGFDRIAAWCLGLGSVRDVIAFPFDRA
ncbi:EF-P lysine aminoacylase EpmA [Planctomicrobium sp. SH661]|uniref:EF-P lysine aminoacylase EpmA n=1 Tax=Planctomicrobium sp. SH661 TaxID=3448124 RepID=UPI003F5B53AC